MRAWTITRVMARTPHVTRSHNMIAPVVSYEKVPRVVPQGRGGAHCRARLAPRGGGGDTSDVFLHSLSCGQGAPGAEGGGGRRGPGLEQGAPPTGSPVACRRAPPLYGAGGRPPELPSLPLPLQCAGAAPRHGSAVPVSRPWHGEDPARRRRKRGASSRVCCERAKECAPSTRTCFGARSSPMMGRYVRIISHKKSPISLHIANELVKIPNFCHFKILIPTLNVS